MDNQINQVMSIQVAEKLRVDRGLTQQQMADYLGISQVVYNQIKSGRTKKISFKIGEKITEFIKKNGFITSEKIDPSQIKLTTEGKLKRHKVLSQFNQIPYYDVDFIAGTTMETLDSGAVQPAYFMDVPIFKDCAAFNTYSDSMEPMIQKGSIIFCTFVKDWHDVLEYGQIYAISLHDNRRFLKYIQRHEKHETHFILSSENKHYDPFPVPKSKIKGIWLVHGFMNKRTQ